MLYECQQNCSALLSFQKVDIKLCLESICKKDVLGQTKVFLGRGVARVKNREGQIIFKGAQSREGALKRGAECPKRGAICLKRGVKCFKRALDA